MPVWRLEDDCLAPTATLRIDFEGPNPFLIYQRAGEILRRIFQVETADYWERDFRWDISSDPRDFFVRIFINKGVDVRTKILAEVVMQGKQPSDPSKNGKVTIFISARLITEYRMDTIFQKSPIYKFFLWLYHKTLYNEVRRGYLSFCQNLLTKVYNEFRSVLEMSVKV
ncbi:MAG: hypothetical protein QXQ18_00880 [Candidatus Aenigmatarchaeota archaeon]